ncbi:preprotein translocase subunit YajC [Nocardioides sp. SYSU D00038]|uniref:preprotein translocase subunit YajC n=1 Tax=Nocardioides sp. SYSU D00038 TaxID=2812554 RepID=UPI0019680A25|nr:preprotein translocase subunit YajC [Nocardioides sp. SYSU D00038]
MQQFAQILPLVGIVLLFWLLVIRPQMRRQRELQRMQSALSVGDEVMLTSGIAGTLRETHDDFLRVEIADGVSIKVARGAIGSILTDRTTTEPDPGHQGEPEES